MKKFRKYLFLLIILMMIDPITVYAVSYDLSEDSQAVVNEIKSDQTTMDNYRGYLLDPDRSTINSGNLWADKSVYANTTKGVDQFDLDGDPIYFDTDFAEVFSLLGSSYSTKGLGSDPIDLIITIDLSTTLGQETTLEYDLALGRIPKKIDKTAEALDNIINFLVKQNENNRIGVVGFAATALNILPLGRYTPIDNQKIFSVEDRSNNGDIPYYCLKVNCQNQEGETITKNIYNGSISSPGANDFKIGNYTNLQAGIAIAADSFLENSKTDNRPKLIIISDGEPNTVNPGGWLNLKKNQYFELDSDKDYAPILLSTLLTAAYKKAAINKIYEHPLEVITLGVDIESSKVYDALVRGSLRPHEYFTRSGVINDPKLTETYNLWQRWINEGSLKFTEGTFNDYNLELESFPISNPYNLTKEDLTGNIGYVDSYKDLPSSNQSQVFEDIITGYDETMFDLLDSEVANSEGDVGVVTYIDPIGKYLELKNIRSLYLYGQLYKIVKEKENYLPVEGITTVTYKVFPNGDSKVTNENRLVDQVFSTDEFEFTYIKNDDNTSYLRIVIPEAAIPILKTSVTFSADQDENGNRLIKEYSITSDSKFSKPLRILYTVGLNENLILENGALDLSKIDSEYLAEHDDNGEIGFYSNSYTNSEIFLNKKTETRGEAYISFSPNPNNPYFFNQEERAVYKSSNTLSTLNSLNTIDPEEIYYTKASYYRPEVSKNYQGKVYESLDPILGAEILKNKAYLNSQAGSIVYIPKGSIQRSKMINKSEIKQKNNTETASLVIYPSFDTENKQSKIYLGNNGKIAVTGASPKIILEKYQAIGSEAHKKDPLNVTAGDIITYQLKLINLNDTSSSKIIVTDEVPTGLVFVESSITRNGTYNEGIITWEIESLAGNSEEYLEFQVTVPNISSGSWTNVASFRYDGLPSDPQNRSNEVISSINEPNVILEKLQSVNENSPTKEPQSVKEGDKVTYYFRVTNTGTASATNVVISDDIPKDLILVSNTISSEGEVYDKNISWILDELRPNESKLLKFSVMVPEGTLNKDWTNSAFVSHDQKIEPVESNAVFINKNETSIEIKKTQSVNNSVPTTNSLNANPLDIVTYFLTITNTGTSNIENVTVTDPIPSSLIVDQDSITNRGIFENNSITWTLSSISPDSNIILSFKASIPEKEQAAIWTNTASLSFNENTIYSNTVNIIEEFDEILDPGPNDNTSTTYDPSNNNTNDPSTNITDEVDPSNISEINYDPTNDLAPSFNPTNTVNTPSSIAVESPKTGIETYVEFWLSLLIISSLILFDHYHKLKKSIK